MGETENIESWVHIHRFIDGFKHERWMAWQRVAKTLIAALEERKLAPLFRIGQSLHHIILSTKEKHGLEGEAHVTLVIGLQEPTVTVAYGYGNLHFDESQLQETCRAETAVPTILKNLKRLWIETKPDSPVPAELAD